MSNPEFRTIFDSKTQRFLNITDNVWQEEAISFSIDDIAAWIPTSPLSRSLADATIIHFVAGDPEHDKAVEKAVRAERRRKLVGAGDYSEILAIAKQSMGQPPKPFPRRFAIRRADALFYSHYLPRLEPTISLAKKEMDKIGRPPTGVYHITEEEYLLLQLKGVPVLDFKAVLEEEKK